MADGEVKYKVTIDDSGAVKSLDKVKSGAENAGEKGATGIAKLGTALKVAAAAGAAMLIAKLGEVGKAALDAYANYEQLVGGVETLFKESAPIVQQYAANAYQTAGMSANQYMQTVTSFSGALLRSVAGDTAEAARLSDVAISDMADQANKYGTSIEMVKDTYLSLARGNTQTLDNLFGGMFAGTKQGLRDMLDYAEEYQASLGNVVSYSTDSYADIVSAIHDVSASLGVMGTTSAEAATTIQGSQAMMQAAWENMLVGMVDSTANKTQLMTQLFDSIKVYLSNLMPAIGSLIVGFIESLPAMLDNILLLVEQLISDISANLPVLIENLIVCLANLIATVLNHVPNILAAGVELIIGLGRGLIQAIPELIQNIPTIINSLFNALLNGIGSMINAGIELLTGVKGGGEQGAHALLDWFAGLPGRILGALGNLGNLLVNAGSQIIGGLLSGITSKFEAVQNFVGGIGSWIQQHKGPEQYDKTLLIRQGGWIMEGLAAGLESGRADVLGALQDITADIQGYTIDAPINASMAGSGATTNNSVINVSINGLDSASPAVQDAAANLVSALQLDIRLGTV